MLLWYGLGSNLINIGLPMHVDVDRKPEYGCKIQNLCDGHSGTMLRIFGLCPETLCFTQIMIWWVPKTMKKSH